MKIRNGFVSNSSTSSFVVVCKVEDHDKVLAKLHPYYAEWFKQKISPEEQTFLGAKILVTSITICSEDEEPIEWKGKYPKEAEDFFGDGTKMVLGNDIMERYIEELEKISNDVIVQQETR